MSRVALLYPLANPHLQRQSSNRPPPALPLPFPPAHIASLIPWGKTGRCPAIDRLEVTFNVILPRLYYTYQFCIFAASAVRCCWDLILCFWHPVTLAMERLLEIWNTPEGPGADATAGGRRRRTAAHQEMPNASEEVWARRRPRDCEEQRGLRSNASRPRVFTGSLDRISLRG